MHCANLLLESLVEDKKQPKASPTLCSRPNGREGDEGRSERAGKAKDGEMHKEGELGEENVLKTERSGGGGGGGEGRGRRHHDMEGRSGVRTGGGRSGDTLKVQGARCKLQVDRALSFSPSF